jgi:hypothetical protein
MTLVDNPATTFTTQELARLGAYKAAVAAGFFTDWDGTAEWTDTHALAWLRSASVDGAESFPFTPEERARLERTRAAVKAGYYTDATPAESRPRTETLDGPAR